MNPVPRKDFSAACPACGSANIRPVTQQNRFDHTTPSGEPVAGARHVRTSRQYECDHCNHRWTEEVPHPR